MTINFTVRNDEPVGGAVLALSTLKNGVEGEILIAPGEEYGCDTSFECSLSEYVPTADEPEPPAPSIGSNQGSD